MPRKSPPLASGSPLSTLHAPLLLRSPLLLRWYTRHARDLPWRRTRDVYAVWVSEIMLQQTQVATVIPYYERFLRDFPTVSALASASEHDVLRRWEGLGYYRRARQLHAAAKKIVEQHNGEFPEDIAEATRLPGIGRYTAGAVLSIARDQRLPILEANTIRLFSRLLLYKGDLNTSSAKNRLWQFAEEVLPRKNVGRFNQALMELGSQVCLPRAPLCHACPLVRLCPTYARGWQDRIPKIARKKVYEEVREGTVVVRRGHEVLLRQCGDDERWAGLWDFPRFALTSVEPQHIEAMTLEMTGIHARVGRRLTTIRHGVTRFRITLECYDAEYLSGAMPHPSVRWVSDGTLGDYALSVTGRKIATLLISGDSPRSCHVGGDAPENENIDEVLA